MSHTHTQLFALVPINKLSSSFTRIDGTVFDGTPRKSHRTESESLMKVAMAAYAAYTWQSQSPRTSGSKLAAHQDEQRV